MYSIHFMLFMIDIHCYTSQGFDSMISKLVPMNSASALDTTLLDCIVLLVVLALANRSQHFPHGCWQIAGYSLCRVKLILLSIKFFTNYYFSTMVAVDSKINKDWAKSVWCNLLITIYYVLQC